VRIQNTEFRTQNAGERYVPTEFLTWFPPKDGADRLEVVRRYAANHGPFAAAGIERRYGFDPLPELEALEQERVAARGAFTPGGSGEEWCLVENLRQLHRQSLAILREQIEPREPA